jgi:rSAM/selenodomain-associated transferase 1
VILFMKAPEKGCVKTRLAVSLGEEIVLDLYRCFVEDSIQTIVREGYELLIFYDPPSAHSGISQWLGERHPLLPQSGIDLGERMQNAFRRVFSRGRCAAVIVGSDSPDLTSRFYHEAFAALRDHDAVVGPAHDGGYYLIGFRREAFLPDAFAGISWSTPEVFTRTLVTLRNCGRSVHLLPPWRDVDTIEDLRALVLRNGETSFSGSASMTRLRKAYGPAGIP